MEPKANYYSNIKKETLSIVKKKPPLKGHDHFLSHLKGTGKQVNIYMISGNSLEDVVVKEFDQWSVTINPYCSKSTTLIFKHAIEAIELR